ncbi:histidine phosphatase family protein [Brachymonas denitrificans]|uniref:histidine phosphatase family protein n=1 Tax=Brachymonas denitrificans TaxID=28220 RepID=UPI002AFE36CD|nr:histidine phosphatase family protein [Brachymonas denitrificans]
MSIAAATRLLIIRHGETAWNAERRIQGHTDIPLNDTGRQQARALAEALNDSPIHAVYCSDLQRAEETGRIIASSHDARVITTPQLRERHFGHIEGKTFIDFEVHFPDESMRWRKRDPNWAPPGGGESLADLRDRIVQTVNDIGRQHNGEHVAIVSHGGVLDVLYRAAARLGLQAARTWYLPNCAINRLLWTPDGLTLIGWGDTRHLDALDGPALQDSSVR